MFLIVVCVCLQTLTDLPQSLKEVLLGAHEQIKEHGTLPELPSRPCVNDILKLYVEQKQALQHDNAIHEEVGASMVTLFPFSHLDAAFYTHDTHAAYCCTYVEQHLETNSSLALYESS